MTTRRKARSRGCAPPLELAAGQGSVALLRRCEDDLAPRRSPSAPGSPGWLTRERVRERRANAARPSSWCPQASIDRPKETRMSVTTADITTAPLRANCPPPCGAPSSGRGIPATTQARAVYNAMIDKHPAAIARCRDVADVIACVRFARAHGIEHRRPGRRSQRRRPGGRGRRACHRPVGAAQHHGRARRTTPCASIPAAPGATSITRPGRSGWPPRRGSSPRPAWRA